MIEKLSIYKLFGDMTFEFLRPLKAQTAALMAEKPEHLALAWKFMLSMGYSEKFEASILKGVQRILKQSGIATVTSDEECQLAWNALASCSTDHLQDKKVVLGVAKALEALVKGASVLSTHVDKSSEFPQTITAKTNFLKGLTDALGCSVQTYDSPDARVLVKSAFQGNLPIGVTMSAQDQAELGLVCSAVNPLLTSVGNAGDAPLQYLFLINLCTQDSAPITFFEVLSARRLDIIGLMLGLDHVPAEAEMTEWLSNITGELALMAGLYFGVNYMIYGAEYEAQYQTMKQVTEVKLALEPGSLVNAPEGRGISMIRLPVAGGYRLATPLLNAGLLRDIHQMLKHEWNAPQPIKRLTNVIRVGGSKPQNAGSFFSIVMNNGRINGLNAYLPSQISGGRMLQKKLMEGRPIYNLKLERALEISSRRPSTDHAWLSKPLHRRAKLALESRVDWFVADVLGSLQAINDYAQTNKAVHFFLMQPVDSAWAKAERELILDRATDDSIFKYASYLQKQVFAKVLLTSSEKHVFTKRLVLALKQQMQEF